MRAAAIPQSGNILYCGVRILPGEQPGEYEDEKLEIMVLELKKLPPEAQSEEGWSAGCVSSVERGRRI